MKNIIIVISIILIAISCTKKNQCSYINDYYQIVYKAEEAFYNSDFERVVSLMDEVCKKCEPLNQQGIYELYKYAESASRIGEHDKAIRLIEKLFLKGYEVDNISKNEGFSQILNLNGWKELVEKYDELHEKYMKGINLNLRNQIKEMKEADQYYRKMLKSNNINKDSIWLLIDSTDSINDIKFKEILENYGYPNERIIGGFNIDNEYIDAGILLFHFDDYEYYTTTLKKLIDQGNAPPISLGSFVDSYQRRVKDKKKYIYGIYDNVEADKIIDYDNLDKRRISIGLAPRELKRKIDLLSKKYYDF